uniref:28S ribosomal protein S17, mitochondrial n=1 Tax=Fundulus heteroclitus TaxID=8078 RepID=A0A146S4R8_FUNHE
MNKAAANAFSVLVGQVHRIYPQNTRQALIRSLHMELDQDIVMYFNKIMYLKAFLRNEQVLIGDMVLLRRRPKLECRSPDERFEVIERLYPVGQSVDPLSGMASRGIRYADES